jgi:hypothetical protein
MTVTADQIRELLTHVEGTKLDFKARGYDWNNDGNFELAKDLMAMANVLSVGAEPSHLLVGVAEGKDHSGTLVGVAVDSHPDDADVHQRVSGLLNRVPNFSYQPIEIDGLSIGVYEIRAGGRPFYPIRDRGSTHRLVRRLPLFRDGSSTDAATPDQVLGWGREDDPVGNELKSLQLEKARAGLAIMPHVRAYRTPNTRITLDLIFSNRGERPFTITDGSYEVTHSPQFFSVTGLRAPAAAPVIRTGPIQLSWAGGAVVPGEERRGRLDCSDNELRRAAASLLGHRADLAWQESWASFMVVLKCEAGERLLVHRQPLIYP